MTLAQAYALDAALDPEWGEARERRERDRAGVPEIEIRTPGDLKALWDRAQSGELAF
jgi:hypothetical protein